MFSTKYSRLTHRRKISKNMSLNPNPTTSRWWIGLTNSPGEGSPLPTNRKHYTGAFRFRRRVFFDIFGVIGDTTAINRFLDVLNHQANTCCHICRRIWLRPIGLHRFTIRGRSSISPELQDTSKWYAEQPVYRLNSGHKPPTTHF